jgi:hypothetical protein
MEAIETLEFEPVFVPLLFWFVVVLRPAMKKALSGQDVSRHSRVVCGWPPLRPNQTSFPSERENRAQFFQSQVACFSDQLCEAFRFSVDCGNGVPEGARPHVPLPASYANHVQKL